MASWTDKRISDVVILGNYSAVIRSQQKRSYSARSMARVV